jgi:ATP-dependent Clp protease adaptor protein ClpS
MMTAAIWLPAARPRASWSLRSPVAAAVLPQQMERPKVDDELRVDKPWITIVWNDPINLMSYVAFVFQKLFGYSREKAHKLMLDVHHKGRAVVASGSREQMEHDVSRLHAHGLWATLQQD